MKLAWKFLLVWLAALAATPARADIVVIESDATAVSSPDAIATFDAVTTGTDLTSYTESGLSITVPTFAFTGYDPGATGVPGSFSGGFHYPSGGTTHSTDIAFVDGSTMGGVEFIVGNGFTTSDTFYAWEAYLGGTLVGSGSGAVLSGTTLAFVETGTTAGFDLLRVGAYIDAATAAAAVGSVETTYQVIAIDNVEVIGLTAVPEPSSLALAGLLAAGAARRFRSRRESSAQA